MAEPLTPSSAELALADEHDAAGRHHDAIDALARGTSAGNLACMRQLGKRLLAGDRAPAAGRRRRALPAGLIARARGHLTRALLYDAVNQQDFASKTRTNSVANFGVANVELLEVLLQAKMSFACSIPMNHMEAPAVLNYQAGEEATEHYDFVDPKTPDYAAEIARNGQRVLTFLVYLNGDYEGGETNFPTLGISHKGTRGGALFFVNAQRDMQPDLRMLHAGRAPTRGEKWIVSQFIRNRPVLTPMPPRTPYGKARYSDGPGCSAVTCCRGADTTDARAAGPSSSTVWER